MLAAEAVTLAPSPTVAESDAETVDADAPDCDAPLDEDADELAEPAVADDVVIVEPPSTNESSCVDAGDAELSAIVAESVRVVEEPASIVDALDGVTTVDGEALADESELLEEASETTMLASAVDTAVSPAPRPDAVDVDTEALSVRPVESVVSSADALDGVTVDPPEAAPVSVEPNVLDADGTVLAASVELVESVGSRVAAEAPVGSPLLPTDELSSVDAGDAELAEAIAASVDADESVESGVLELAVAIDATSAERPVSVAAETDAVLSETDALAVL